MTTKKQGGTTYTEKDGYSDLKVKAPRYEYRPVTQKVRFLAIVRSMECLMGVYK